MNPDDLTTRDLYALVAWHALLRGGVETSRTISELAYIHADEMMAEQARQQPTTSGS